MGQQIDQQWEIQPYIKELKNINQKKLVQKKPIDYDVLEFINDSD